jgi:hypothetical protein
VLRIFFESLPRDEVILDQMLIGEMHDQTQAAQVNILNVAARFGPTVRMYTIMARKVEATDPQGKELFLRIAERFYQSIVSQYN